MAEPLALVPPGAVLVAAAVVVALVDRRLGTVLGVAVAAAVTVWITLLPAGTYLQGDLFGFDVVLLHVDPLSRTVGAILAFLAAATVAYGHGTGASTRQLALSLAYLGTGLLAAFAGDWLTLVLAWEALAVGATALLWMNSDAAATRAGLRYAIYHELGGLVLLAAVLVHLDQTGTLVFDGGLHAGLATTLGLLGIGLNVGFIGLHPWIVDSYPRPHVAASVVLAACTTKVGVYALARAVPDGSVVVASLGGAMLVVGVTYAILQTDLRRLLSYHIVSQVGIMVAGIGVGTSLGVAGAIAHLVNNVLYKSLLFMVAGVIIVRTGESNLKHLGGLARPMPGTFGAFLVAALGITGVPGFNGFVSKGMVFDAAEAAGFDLLWWLLVVGSVGTVVSFAKFGYYAFVRQGPERDVADAGRSESIGLVALAIPCLAFGLAPGLQFAVLPGSTAAAKPFAPSQFAKAAAILGAGSVAFVLLKRSLSRVSGVPDLDAVYHPLGRWLLWTSTGAIGGLGRWLDTLVDDVAANVVRLSSPDGTGWMGWDGLADDVGAGVLLVVLSLVALLFVLII
ncbi:proton-conducting transporter membrane subunit [Haloarculaceae archaeon H-GB1-1]|nr:proton-conducting transporter membrane subunit [Haloarculaceae archaeon H-GB1-1]